MLTDLNNVRDFNKIANVVQNAKLVSAKFKLVIMLLLSFSTIFYAAVLNESYAQPTPKIINSVPIFSQLKLDAVKSSGLKLMNLPLGLHQLNNPIKTAAELKKRGEQGQIESEQPRRISLLVHGYKSQGYEWIYAIKQFAKVSNTFYLRWNWQLCPRQGAQVLSHYIGRLQNQYPQAQISVYGHSYGGVITAISAANYAQNLPLSAHIIASPVAGHPKLEQSCGQSISKLTQKLSIDQSQLNPNLQIYQWRTQKELDGAFKGMDYNPQLVKWHGTATELPTTYRGHRLGHNWSISWVVDTVLKQL